MEGPTSNARVIPHCHVQHCEMFSQVFVQDIFGDTRIWLDFRFKHNSTTENANEFVYTRNSKQVAGGIFQSFYIDLPRGNQISLSWYTLTDSAPCTATGWISSWWRHQMETFSALLSLCAGNSPVTGEFPAQRPVMRSFDVFFVLPLNKRLGKQWWG